MATVFRAVDRSLDRPVAIKVLQPHLASAVGAERFVREARRLAGLSHPYLLSVHEAGEADGLFYYVMDLIEAPSLREVLARGPLSPRRATTLVSGLLDALAVVHTAGLVHRDIKPENIFVRGDHPLLADFGIAKSILEEGSTFTKAGSFLGTPAYMSPEQAQGRPVGTRSDLYSVGQLLYECLTGRRWLLGARSDEADWSGIPSSIRPVLARALEPLEAKRWPDASSFRSALSGKAVAVGRPPARGAVYALVAVVVVALGVAIWSPWSAPRPATIRSVAVLPCEVTSPEGDSALALEVHVALAQAFRPPSLDLVVSSYSRWSGPVDAPRIADSLGVDATVTCSVRRGGEGGRRAIGTIRLSGRGPGPPLWEWSFDEERADFKNIARVRVARELGHPIARESVAAGSTPPPQAIDEYADARLEFSKRSEAPDHVSKAIDHYERALQLFPNWDVALSGLAECYIALFARSAGTPTDFFPRADSLASLAIRINDALAEPYAVLGETVRAYKWDEWETAEGLFKGYIERVPGSGEGRLWYALWLAAGGRFPDADSQATAAVDGWPEEDGLKIGLGHVLYVSGNYERAIDVLEEVVGRWPGAWEGQLWLVAALIGAEREDDARVRLNGVRESMSDLDAATRQALRPILAAGYAAVGDSSIARELLGPSPPPLTPFWNAITYTSLGDLDAAFEQLENAYNLNDEFLTFVGVFPLLEPLRQDARYDSLAVRLKFPWMRGS